MRITMLVFAGALGAVGLAGCSTGSSGGKPAVGYGFESDAAAHIFYQAILDRTTLPLQTKKKYLDTPLLVVQKVGQVSGASIAREAAAKADTDRDATISEAEARAFAGSGF